ncbi:gamma-glutamylcyclotransferase family protein [Halorubrum sp. DTA98]|uniref:gamma-glutamylcyclotransferase family protein n=1 Tax=Halorubrum sp. DTA98 TaxID=3402163 RepID=UPI003AADF911
MDVFVYGTLTDPVRVRGLLDSFVFVGSATLHGLHLVEGAYPTLAPDGETAGRLLRTEDIDALDAYEGVDDDLYTRSTVPLDGPTDAPANDPTDASADYPTEAVVYVGDPERLDADATWPGDGPFPDRVRSYLDTNDVRVSVDELTPV